MSTTREQMEDALRQLRTARPDPETTVRDTAHDVACVVLDTGMSWIRAVTWLCARAAEQGISYQVSEPIVADVFRGAGILQAAPR